MRTKITYIVSLLALALTLGACALGGHIGPVGGGVGAF
jgi:hypothetical protein